MKQYKHYSFDFWLTLFKSDGAFKKKRAEFFFLNYNPLEMPLKVIEGILTGIDHRCNAINESTELNVDAVEMYALALYELGVDMKSVTRMELENIYIATERLFLENPPAFYDQNTEEVLAMLKIRGASISILSNTAFIQGRTLSKLIQKLRLNRYIDFEIYSDQHNASKPSEKLFNKMIEEIAELRSDMRHADIIHIGDNPIADGEGAKKAGIDFFIINSNTNTIKDIL